MRSPPRWQASEHTSSSTPRSCAPYRRMGEFTKSMRSSAAPVDARPPRRRASTLKLRRYLGLLHLRGEMLDDGNGDEGDPQRRRAGLRIEVLMLDAARLHRQQQQVALLPVDP